MYPSARHEASQNPLSRQQGRPAEQALRGLRLAYELAPQLGQKLGRGQILLRGLPARQEPVCLSYAT